MIKRLLPVLILFMLPLQAAALFDTATDLYNKGDYLGAAAIYEARIESADVRGQNNPFLFYNLGNSYFKAGDIDRAILNYYRAFNILPRDRNIRGNLAFAMASTGQSLAPEGMPDIVFNLYHYFSITELKGLLWLAVWLFAAALCVYIFTRRKRVLIAAAIALIFFGTWYLMRLPAASERKAVVIMPRAEVRSGPGDSFPVSLSLPRAYIVVITDAKGDFAEVSGGWILKKSIEEI